jgi:hypothetical protein
MGEETFFQIGWRSSNWSWRTTWMHDFDIVKLTIFLKCSCKRLKYQVSWIKRTMFQEIIGEKKVMINEWLNPYWPTSLIWMIKGFPFSFLVGIYLSRCAKKPQPTKLKCLEIKVE